MPTETKETGTATQAMRSSTVKERFSREQEYFARQLTDFIRRWKPDDGREAGHFESETYFLMQRAQALAQQPILEAYTALAATLPFPPLRIFPDAD